MPGKLSRLPLCVSILFGETQILGDLAPLKLCGRSWDAAGTIGLIEASASCKA